MFYNCFPVHDSVIKIPTRRQLLPIAEALTPKITDIVFPVYELVELLATHTGQHFNVNVSHATSGLVLPNDMDVNGFYDQDADEDKKAPISLVLITCPTDQMLLWTTDDYLKVSYRILDTIVHEVTHLLQARMRNFVDVTQQRPIPLTEQESAIQYLSTPDEIDAYARNIADELHDYKELIKKLNWLATPSVIPLDVSPNLWAYVNTFDKNIDHPVLKKLLKKIWKHL